MYYTYWQEQNKIEIALTGELTREEFLQVIHQLESLCTMYQEINVLLDAARVEKYAFNVIWDEIDFFKKYKKHLKRVAIVSDFTFESFILKMFSNFTETEFKTFKPEQLEEARKWIFPSRLP